MVEYQGSQAMHCEQPQVDHKEQQLQSLRDNAVKCLTIVLVSDLDYITDLVHVLMYNTSVKHLALVSAARQDYDAYPTNDAEWVLLLKGFQSRALGERIESLLLQDQDVPFCMIPNALWQFRSLRSLVICKSACDSWEEDHWQVFSIAIRAHSSLQKLKMEQTSNGNAMGAPIDTLALAVATSLTLREYIHVGPRDPLSKSCTQHQQLSVDSMAALVRSTTLHNLTYHRSGLYSTKSSIGLIDALKMTTLLQLSISGNKIDFAAHGVQENTSLKKLDLSENDFGKHDGVAATLSTMLRHNKTLTHLNICNCNLNSIQFAQILEALQCNKSLVSLKLGNSSDTESTLIDALAGDEHDNLDPGTGRLLHNLHNLIAWNNATVTFLQVSTRDFCLDSEEDCPGLTVKIVVYNYRNMFVLARALQMIKFGLELNRAGRRNIVPDGNQPNRR